MRFLLAAVAVTFSGLSAVAQAPAGASSSASCTLLGVKFAGIAGGRTYYYDLRVGLTNLRPVKARIVATITDTWGWKYKVGAVVRGLSEVVRTSRVRALAGVTFGVATCSWSRY